MVKRLAAIGELIKTAATIRSTRTVKYMHEVCSSDADLDLLTAKTPLDRYQRRHQTSCSQKCATPAERAQRKVLARRDV